MSTATDAQANGNGRLDHDHILRPRAVKPSNPGVLRALSDDRHLSTAPKDILELGGSGQTRFANSLHDST